MKALGLVVSDEKVFENCHLKTYCLTPWPTYNTNWNNLNNFGRGPPRDHFCDVWSKSNERFQRRWCWSKKVYGRRTTDDARRTTTDDGQRPITIVYPEHFVLRWAKKDICVCFNCKKLEDNDDDLCDYLHLRLVKWKLIKQEQYRFSIRQAVCNIVSGCWKYCWYSFGNWRIDYPFVWPSFISLEILVIAGYAHKQCATLCPFLHLLENLTSFQATCR